MKFNPVLLMRRMFSDRYTSSDDDDDVFFSKYLPPAHTPSRTTQIRRGKAPVKLPATKPNIKEEPIIELSSEDEYKSVFSFFQ